jgi:type I restriction enzyme S subunit
MKINKRNKNRPGYKETKVGWIPKDWGCKKFGEFASFKNGLNFLKNDHGHYYRIIGVSGFQDLFSPTCNSFEVIEIKRKLDADELLSLGDLLFVRSNGNKQLIGRCLYIDKLDTPTSFSGFTIRARITSPSLNPIYAAIYFKTWLARKQILTLGGGTNISNLSQSILSSIIITHPSLKKQKRIVEILSAWDRGIEQVERLIDAKQRLKKGLMQQLLTGRMRFKEFGEPSTKRDRLPEGWKEVKLADCFQERNENNPELPLLAITSNRGVISRDEIDRKDTSTADKSNYKRIAPHDIGYNTMRMWQGVSAVSELEGIVSPAYTICTPQKGCNPKFFEYLFKFRPVVHLFFRYSQGLVSDTLNLKYSNFSKIKIKIAEENEQCRIAAILEACDREIEQLRNKETALKEQKKDLMQKLLTGEVRVKLPKE